MYICILYILFSTFVCNNKDFWKLHKMYNFPHFPSPTYIHDDTDTELSIQSARVYSIASSCYAVLLLLLLLLLIDKGKQL